MKNKAELIFVPFPGMGHIVSTVEFAKRLLDQDQRFSITVLIIRPHFGPPFDAIKQAIASSDTRIRYIDLPQVEPPTNQQFIKSPEKALSDFLASHKPHVKDAITNHVLVPSSSSDEVRLAGLVVDLFCASMTDVADELGIPSYTFFTSSAAFLGLVLYLPIHYSNAGTEFDMSDPDSIIPSYANPVPASVLPSVLLNKEGGYASFLDHAQRFKEAKGIIVNTFAELEPHALNSFLRHDHYDAPTPPVYAIGPLLDLKGRISGSDHDKVMKWLNKQPPSSVVFLCFGSLGTFSLAQITEMANGLERSGHKFLWSIRQPLSEKFPGGGEDYEEILPNGFLKRTEGRGMVCGWAPQIEVLGHRAVGVFVSHCGWNSILESLWHGVPIVTWPIYAEQQINAFQMVKDLGLAVELKLDYRDSPRTMEGSNFLVTAEEIERAVKCAMHVEDGNSVKARVREMGKKSRNALADGGSSFASLRRLVENMLGNN